jgi:capsular polysaccharide biosynthesis protein
MSGFLRRAVNSLQRRTDEFLRRSPLLRPWRIDRVADVAELPSGQVEKLHVIERADPHVDLGLTEVDAPFVRMSRYFREGWYARSEIYLARVLDGYLHAGTGLICTPDWTALNDSQMTYRMAVEQAKVGNKLLRPYRGFKPTRLHRMGGRVATISNIYMRYWGHWIFDCLPRLYSLSHLPADEKVTLVISDDLPASWYDSLACLLPPQCKVLRLPPRTWVQADDVVLASYASGRANSHMPPAFYAYVRHGCFARFGLPLEPVPRERIYVSRAGTRHRRVLNESEMVAMLQRYGFRVVRLEDLDFRAQVELFHGAAVIVAADGSNWANMMFAGPIKICVLYAHGEPNTHWFTAAKALHQNHYFWAAPGAEPHADFTVNLDELEQVLTAQMGLATVSPP